MKQLLFLGVVVLLPLLGLELALRVLNGFYFQAPDYLQPDEQLGTIPRSSFSQTVGVGKLRNTISHNSVGIRGPEIENPAPDLRVFLIGDSYTYGWGTNDEGTISSHTASILSTKGIDAEVLNMGVGGYSTAQSALRFERFAKLRPQVVIYLFCDNDPEDNIVFENGGKHPKSPGSHRAAWRVLLRRNLLLLRAVKQKRVYFNKPKKPGGSKEGPRALLGNIAYTGTATSGEKKADRTLHFVRMMAETAKKLDAEFAISFVNFMVNDDNSIALSPHSDSYRELFEREGYVTVSPAAAFNTNNNTDWEKLAGDVPFMGHYNSDGYALIAQALADHITSQRLPQK